MTTKTSWSSCCHQCLRPQFARVSQQPRSPRHQCGHCHRWTSRLVRLEQRTHACCTLIRQPRTDNVNFRWRQMIHNLCYQLSPPVVTLAVIVGLGYLFLWYVTCVWLVYTAARVTASDAVLSAAVRTSRAQMHQVGCITTSDGAPVAIRS
jgi:hypothetical protein